MKIIIFFLSIIIIQSYTTIERRSCSASCEVEIEIEKGLLCCPSPTSRPTFKPTFKPTLQPTISQNPTTTPTFKPSSPPTLPPTYRPSTNPTIKPSPLPTNDPTFLPTSSPSLSLSPTSLPTLKPSYAPSLFPTLRPTPPRVLKSLVESNSDLTVNTYSDQDPTLFDLFSYVYVHGLLEKDITGSCNATCEINEVTTTICSEILTYTVEEETVKQLNCLSLECQSGLTSTKIFKNLETTCYRSVSVHYSGDTGDDSLPGWAVALIVIFLICGCCGAGAKGKQYILVEVNDD